MTGFDPTPISAHLRPAGDGFDDERAALARAIEDGAPDVRERTYRFANLLWEPVAYDAWNGDLLAPEVGIRCRIIRDLCTWALEHGTVEGEERYDRGGCRTVAAMMHHVLGDAGLAAEELRIVVARPVNSYFHESASEKLARVLIDAGRTDEALDVLRTLQAQYPRNEYAARCLEAYEIDQRNAAAASLEGIDAADRITPAEYQAYCTQLSERFQADMQDLVTQGLPADEMSARMAQLQQEFQARLAALSARLG